MSTAKRLAAPRAQNGAIKIESGVPLPINGRRIYPWAEMETGDSFAIPFASVPGCRSGYYNYRRKHHNVKFSIRKTPEGYRVWRVA